MSKNTYKIDILKPFIIQTMSMTLSEKEALDYLLKQGYKVSRAYYHQLKKQIKESRFDRLALIAKTGFVDQHLERIDQLELINREYWKLYKQEKDTFKKAQILEKIAELQTYISPYYEASKWIMEESIKRDEQDSKQQQLTQEQKEQQQKEREIQKLKEAEKIKQNIEKMKQAEADRQQRQQQGQKVE